MHHAWFIHRVPLACWSLLHRGSGLSDCVRVGLLTMTEITTWETEPLNAFIANSLLKLFNEDRCDKGFVDVNLNKKSCISSLRLHCYMSIHSKNKANGWTNLLKSTSLVVFDWELIQPNLDCNGIHICRWGLALAWLQQALPLVLTPYHQSLILHPYG